MFNIARAMLVLKAHRSGMTLTEIGETYGFTKERARQLCKRALEIEQQKNSKDPWFELSLRTRNALIKYIGCEPTFDGVLKSYPTIAHLKPVPALGKLCIAELQAWLVRHGREPLK
jgi:hypothetical protein